MQREVFEMIYPEDEILEEYDEEEAFLDHEDFMWHLEREDRIHG